MVDPDPTLLARLRGQAGTTLAELLVAMSLLTIVGTIATVGIVQGFQTQVASVDVAGTLDGMRIATQRVRDFARGADEVCASSTSSSLELWTDHDEDGLVDFGEVDIFELVTDPSGEDVFQRRRPLGVSDEEIQLIRDDIISDALFQYDTDPSTQPLDTACLNGGTVSGGPTRTRTVFVEFKVDHPDPDEDDLETRTTVQVRNSGLIDPQGLAPTPLFDFVCPHGTRKCSFDASESSDIDGDLITVYGWEFGDGDVASGGTPTIEHEFPVGDVDYEVTLFVVDATGQRDSITQTVRPGLYPGEGNARPRPEFTVTCSGVICTFDASGTDDDGGVENIASYTWDFGDGTAPVTETDPTATKLYAFNGEYAVTLTVTDSDATDPKSDSITKVVNASATVMKVTRLDAAGSVPSGGVYTVKVTIQLGLTTAGTPGSGVTISGTAFNQTSYDASCSTDTDGKCTVLISGLSRSRATTFTVTQVSDPSGTYVYDEDQNAATAITIEHSSTATAP